MCLVFNELSSDFDHFLLWLRLWLRLILVYSNCGATHGTNLRKFATEMRFSSQMGSFIIIIDTYDYSFGLLLHPLVPLIAFSGEIRVIVFSFSSILFVIYSL